MIVAGKQQYHKMVDVATALVNVAIPNVQTKIDRMSSALNAALVLYEPTLDRWNTSWWYRLFNAQPKLTDFLPIPNYNKKLNKAINDKLTMLWLHEKLVDALAATADNPDAFTFTCNDDEKIDILHKWYKENQ